MQLVIGTQEMELNEMVSPLGLELARELSESEMEVVGGGAVKQTAGGKVSGSNGNWDAEVHYDVEW
ncbi:hypothetical protein NX80_015515 [Xanthomonas vasicola pv. arecae]|uniref:hypothetical protein n=2 Tax=Xanthomonas vasicola TaxID=56459 RepID=UPI000F8516B2|nr:hypothetical protein [Xanthomonas vasicola]AZR27629.1 hypothetical protein NX80_015515 [Xanthomonas vasicola pv. arecae]